MNKLLEARGLWKTFASGAQKLEVLRGLDLEAREGDMIAITGVSGSGKSTLLHLIGGMDKADAGVIVIQGREISGLDAIALSRFRNETIGFVFQFHHLLPEFTALENVTMPLLLRGESLEKAAETGRGILIEVGLEGRQHHRPGELSGGEQQRVALARALVARPRLLLADEPTGNLDPDTGEAVGRLFRALHNKHGLTSVLVTHNERLAAICSHVFRLEHGRLI
jgi:lipoprotein-releasing system ATP-binding protein